MGNKDELSKAKFLSIGLVLITVLVYTNKVSDPVNSPKFLILGVVSAAVVFGMLGLNLSYVWSNFKALVITIVCMIISMLLSINLSASPLSQNLYGVYGRNTGFLTHIALIGILLSIASLRLNQSLRILFYGMLTAGAINIVYCGWVLLFGDFIQWNNPYKSLLGTLGNPNFISSFLAMTGIGLLGYFGTRSHSVKSLTFGILLLAVIVVEIFQTRSTQGIVILGIGVYVVGFFQLLYKVRKKWLTAAYSSSGISLLIFGILGISNSGPLASILFQETLGYRREYWIAGIKMGLKFPVSGVGMDSYGDWYRELRTAKSAISPGLQVVTNVAHNVYIDAFANGGIPFIVGYLAIFFLTLKAILKSLRQMNSMDPLFVSMCSVWIGFQFQSFISINQIGLVIWGWALSAMLMTYSRIQSGSQPNLNNARHAVRPLKNSSLLSPMALLLGGIVGFITYCPPVLADHKWTQAYSNKNADELYRSLDPSYFTPSNSLRYAEAVQIFESNNLPEKAHLIALEATKFNPRSFDAWQQLYSLQNATVSEKKIALDMMSRLDPLNKTIKSLG